MIPKSLHTVTVLVKIARHLRAADTGVFDQSPNHYVTCALAVLGHAISSDPCQLAARAVAILSAERDQAVVTPTMADNIRKSFHVEGR
jgi:hypothetical protein